MRFIPLLVLLLAGAVSAAPTTLRFDQFYSGTSIRGPEFSPLALSLNGREVSLDGFVAPGEEGELPELLVLTAFPLRECPYCLEAADWPNEVEGMWRHVLVELPRGMNIPAPGSHVRVVGRLELGNRPMPVENVATPLHLRASSVTPLAR
ncbi:hypothetical protein DAERI_020106 [Deinococcus aerius]|uniref:Lipoprotein n=3 Tax=Deinococcus TaxID=1298 RepID=A0A2I9CSB5_9DEIO|nr:MULTISPECIES: hypothetical protein [Deinococcus]ABW35042.1 conserved hypothetical protein [Deinococcus geothermalis DSM 11300]MBB5293611.1 hypothetical protein [Deinococcus metallilatus]QBY07405.1 hypothetical protein E5F05_05390 [Deinococcus metallilatus]RXJ14878.1 hypothetical protein ERJ73_04110 [Deinococcus metallilatus]TLK30999.1 hypothetical protein FCS05_04425 [Deinococcus metallilatus]